MASFGQNARGRREELRMSPEVLAKRLGVKQPTLSAWENDRRGLPEGPTLLKFAKALLWTVDELLAGVDPEYDEIRERRRAELAGAPTSSETELLVRFRALSRDERTGLMRFIRADVHEPVSQPVGSVRKDDVDDRLPHEAGRHRRGSKAGAA